jgi:hypothetical protein
MMLIKIRGDRGNKLAQYLCEEAPLERTFIRKEDKEHQESKDPAVLDSPAAGGDETKGTEITDAMLHTGEHTRNSNEF